MPITKFEVQDGGDTRNILELDLDAENMDKNADDPELREYLVGVDWLDTRPLNEAYWEAGMYANQNTVTRLRDQQTLDRLYEVFDVSPP